MANFLQDLEAKIGDEEVTAVVYIDPRGEEDYMVGRQVYGSPDWETLTEVKVVGPVDWEWARTKFDYDYDTGFGGVDCHAVYLWTPTRIIFVAEYDGATSVQSLPLSPLHSDVVPRFV